MIPATCERLFSSKSHFITARTVPPGHCPGMCYLLTARNVGAVLSQTVVTVSLSTAINRCRRTETVLYEPTQRRPSSGYRGPINHNFLMLCGLPQISSVRLTAACCCCRTHATNEYCCRQTFQNRPTTPHNHPHSNDRASPTDGHYWAHLS